MNLDLQKPAAKISSVAKEQALARQAMLTKPAGSLGMLEDIAVCFAAWQNNPLPSLDQIAVRVYAGDHGVCAQGVSLFPQTVTGQMIQNFANGGAAISVLSEQMKADFQVWNMGTVGPTCEMPSVKNIQIAAGTADFTQQPAMTESDLEACLQAGADSIPNGVQLFIGGEMGIGNTTSASALLAALYDLKGTDVAGRGTGVDDEGLKRKAQVIDQALALHVHEDRPPLKLLQNLGGLEIAALVGAYIACAQQAIPILIDGFISTVALAYAVALNPSVRDWALFGHRSYEQAHGLALSELDAKPILQLDMCLGEGSGAAVAVSVIRSALALHAGMANFADAGVDEKGSL